ncbi:MAG: hypothetical protein R3B36_03750 [Polyangiaceae bacterium]
MRGVRPLADHEATAEDMRATEPMFDASRSGARPIVRTASGEVARATPAPTRSGEYALAHTLPAFTPPVRSPSSYPPASHAPSSYPPPVSYAPSPSRPRVAPARQPATPSSYPPPSRAPVSAPTAAPEGDPSTVASRRRAKPAARSGWASLVFLVLASLALAGAVGFGWTAVVGRHALLVDNAYDVPVVVQAGPTAVTIPPHSTATVRLPSGQHELTATGPDGSERYVLDLPLTRFGRPPRTAVFNVGGHGRLAVVSVAYGGASEATRPKARYLDEARVIILPEVPGARYGDTIDGAFPRELRLPDGKGSLIHVCHVASAGQSGCALD